MVKLIEAALLDKVHLPEQINTTLAPRCSFNVMNININININIYIYIYIYIYTSIHLNSFPKVNTMIFLSKVVQLQLYRKLGQHNVSKTLYILLRSMCYNYQTLRYAIINLTQSCQLCRGSST